jgi:hypothetical protein
MAANRSHGYPACVRAMAGPTLLCVSLAPLSLSLWPPLHQARDGEPGPSRRQDKQGWGYDSVDSSEKETWDLVVQWSVLDKNNVWGNIEG